MKNDEALIRQTGAGDNCRPREELVQSLCGRKKNVYGVERPWGGRAEKVVECGVR